MIANLPCPTPQVRRTTPLADVMIVDDDHQAVAPLQALLEAEGYNVGHVQRLDEAADVIARQRPDAVLLSLHPQTVAGLELLAKIRFLENQQ